MTSLTLLQSWVRSASAVPTDQFFDTLIQKIDDHFDVVTGSHHIQTLTTIKSSTKSQLKGLLFEHVRYWLLQANAFPWLKVKKVMFDPRHLNSHGMAVHSDQDHNLSV